MTKVDGFPIGEEVESVEEREGFAAGLMDRDDHCPSSLRQRAQPLDDVQSRSTACTICITIPPENQKAAVPLHFPLLRQYPSLPSRFQPLAHYYCLHIYDISILVIMKMPLYLLPKHSKVYVYPPKALSQNHHFGFYNILTFIASRLLLKIPWVKISRKSRCS